ncbi:hypothetical protein LMG7143_01670 [Ralstonia thomasii]|jgi:F0F1-type ATP synthase membrane subunit c/vacuolar-type H+-ATPase subunit K|uniref:Uncharacterized protein n=3 Tax=Burkholderiaceae TaxID=119060 RepID=A0ABN9JEH6_9RALS|nr:hypothetical protein LMG7143_01670 [Ralstonia sp. LMG 18095]CAJ0806391.1 hypothetical protein LMG18095_04435 [Ralstonia sp. LMG 18095]
MWEYIQSAMEDRMMRALTIFIACTSAIAIVAAAAYCGHAFGFSHGVESAWNGVQATCEDPEAQTKINGRTYMCVTKEQWNEVAERIFRQGVALGVKRAREAT